MGGGGGASLTTEQASLDPMGLAPGGMAAQAITAPHGAWHQLEMADAHWSSAAAWPPRLTGRNREEQDRQHLAGCLAMHGPMPNQQAASSPLHHFFVSLGPM